MSTHASDPRVGTRALLWNTQNGLPLIALFTRSTDLMFIRHLPN